VTLAPDMTANQLELKKSIDSVQHWVEQREYRGYEPADGNASPLRLLTFGHTFLQRILQQVVLRAPINLRPVLGIRPDESTKARGYMASGYVAMHQQTQDPRYRERAEVCLDWLDKNPSPGYPHHSWGNHYHYATRGGKLPRLEPIMPWTALCGYAFLDAYEAFGTPRYLEVAQSVCGWILSVPRELTDRGLCISYHAFQQMPIHNSNMLAAAMLARTAKLSGDRDGLDVAREAMVYSCSRQLPDGAWLYGEMPKHHWIDNFHTGYNLDSLQLYMECSGDHRFQDNLERGYRYFKANFFEPDGRAKYYNHTTYPIDIQCCAQAIETFTNFADVDPDALRMAFKVAEWTIRNMQDPDGHFYYRDLGWTKVKTPLMHWGQGTMFKALVLLWIKAAAVARGHAVPTAAS
jgi:rhamnogalacturonyl hydrolase YesR